MIESEADIKMIMLLLVSLLQYWNSGDRAYIYGWLGVIKTWRRP